jgi:hypothetical protein
MKRQIITNRDLKSIEKQLQQVDTGVLSILMDNDKIFQIACNFIYLDKNVYAYLNRDEENFEHIKYGNSCSFTVFSSEKLKPGVKNYTYRLDYITISGEVKDIDDTKLNDQVAELYRLKYSRSSDGDEYKVDENLKPILLDTKEIKSFIEEGL